MGCFFTNLALAKSLSINVYLKLKPENHVNNLIKEFNQYLAQQGLLTIFQIKPYLPHHPLHITLYLTDYNSQQIPAIIKKAQALAKQQKPIVFSTGKFVPSQSGYVMLTVAHNKTIQELSNKTLYELAHLHDPQATIPAWAVHDSGRQALFHQYGSPSVLNYFKPHFSIFFAEHLNKKQSTLLYQQLQKLIYQFTQSHKTQVTGYGTAIGVGLADAQGQIIKELAIFSLEP
ncbi:2'-5' RNA ligase family protein [Fluoribacter dumoffii]|uniref:2'-5' RNA ligase n=1 Tax=Fluoribacter dumoffii TaxID=463 RepID=A0A377G683_9GAMM|nr:2'-5' RNA ligase family protein [Fluoribacter dumoffii]KTC91690.1 hypothetical protein Ldum_2758 [Fluoribacter dumoffii NY 23]MCW8387184.1 2'-5' RNA ligase family protein [Fluoribacter dumoffii]MCW8417311.1 2'-5' RNA ligase family protein [Fluoribacter dumoffii]MCW8454848.1 2'-5' RNA ligase family protein [Fluoribacter dumoffii]MCW8461075.1 2'-5' RNA ligase family protein [Fluoribacter dumoffii]